MSRWHSAVRRGYRLHRRYRRRRWQHQHLRPHRQRMGRAVQQHQHPARWPLRGRLPTAGRGRTDGSPRPAHDAVWCRPRRAMPNAEQTLIHWNTYLCSRCRIGLRFPRCWWASRGWVRLVAVVPFVGW